MLPSAWITSPSGSASCSASRSRKVDEVVGPTATAAVQALKPGEVLVLENLRFHPGEQSRRRGVRRATGDTGRRLRQRRLRHLPSQGRLDGRRAGGHEGQAARRRPAGRQGTGDPRSPAVESAAAVRSASSAAARCRTRSASSRACCRASIKRADRRRHDLHLPEGPGQERRRLAPGGGQARRGPRTAGAGQGQDRAAGRSSGRRRRSTPRRRPASSRATSPTAGRRGHRAEDDRAL